MPALEPFITGGNHDSLLAELLKGVENALGSIEIQFRHTDALGQTTSGWISLAGLGNLISGKPVDGAPSAPQPSWDAPQPVGAAAAPRPFGG
jgi:hypothetical protein